MSGIFDGTSAWIMERKWRRIGAHGVTAVLLVLVWWPISALSGASIWHATSATLGAFVVREAEDIGLKGQGWEIGWAEVALPVIVAVVLCAIIGG